MGGTVVRQSAHIRDRSSDEGISSQQLVAHAVALEDPKLLEVFANLDPTDVKTHLKAITYSFHSTSEPRTTSVWEYVNRPPNGQSKAEAVANVLANKASTLEAVGYDTGVVMRYALMHKVWSTHPNSDVRNATAWFNSLPNHETLATGSLAAAQAYFNKKKHLIVIAENYAGGWGPRWYAQLDKSIRPPETLPEKFPLVLLTKIAELCRHGVSLEEANRRFVAGVRARVWFGNNGRNRRDYRDYLIADDIQVDAQSPPESKESRMTKASRTQTTRPTPRHSLRSAPYSLDESHTGGRSDHNDVSKEHVGSQTAEDEEGEAAAASLEQGASTVGGLVLGKDERDAKVEMCSQHIRDALATIKVLIGALNSDLTCSCCCQMLKQGELPQCIEDMFCQLKGNVSPASDTGVQEIRESVEVQQQHRIGRTQGVMMVEQAQMSKRSLEAALRSIILLPRKRMMMRTSTVRICFANVDGLMS